MVPLVGKGVFMIVLAVVSRAIDDVSNAIVQKLLLVLSEEIRAEVNEALHDLRADAFVLIIASLGD